MRKIKVSDKEYEMKELTAAEYMEYLDAQESINETVVNTYKSEHIELMAAWVAIAYGGELTAEDVKNLPSSTVISEFLGIDIEIGKNISANIEGIDENFQSRK